MRRIAFIGIENADSEVLHEALRRNLGADAEINAFERDVAAVTVAPFLVAKNKESGQLEGSSSVAYISSEADSELAKRVGRLSKAGVTVRNGWSDFKTDASDDEIAQWLTTGEWPAPVIEPEDDDEDDLMALLLGDDDEDEEESAPVAVVAPVAEALPVAPVTAAPEGSATEDEEDDLPVFSEPVIADVTVAPEPTYPSRRFDSMGANDGAVVEPVRRMYQVPAEPVDSLDDEDEDDLPLPSFSSAQSEPVATSPVRESPSPAFSDDEDDDLPAFGYAPPVEAAPVFAAAPESSPSPLDEEEDDEDDLPAFTARPTTHVPAEPDMSSFFGDDEDDELPAFSSASKESPVIASEPAASDEFEDDDLPAWKPLAQSEEAELPEPAVNVRPEVDEFSAKPDVNEDDDELPVFRAPSESSVAASESRAGRRAARELPVLGDDDEEDDDLPAFRPVTPSAPVTQAPSYARVPDEDDDEDDLPVFRAPAPAAVTTPADDLFSDDDGLPDFNPAQESEVEAPAPLRRSRRDFLRAAEELASNKSGEAEDDNAGDDLPVFSPQFTVPSVDDDDELPAPARRATVASKERGDDLPAFASRAASDQPEEEEDAEEEDAFEFAPKVKTPRYAAPADKQPAWGVPVQRPEPVAKPEPAPVREEPLKPVKKVAPEAVRYADDNPSEAIALRAKRRRDAEGYEQPVIESDVPDRVLKAAPGETSELRKAAKRVVNQRPAAPIESESLDFMSGPDTNDDFDPNATAPYMEALKPELRRAQSTMEQIRREYDSDAVMKVKSKGAAVCYYVTGSHGGAGKTTSTWMMANTMAAALKNDPLKRPVFLIEGDYENSKLAQRLNLPPEKNSGRLAEFFRKLSSDRSIVSKQKINMYEMTESIIKESIYVNDSGVNVIAAPYDLTKRDGRFLRIAIQKSVEYAERQGGFVFIDADTLSNDDILDRTLAAKATHVILVSFGDKDHVDDTHRAIHTLTTPNVKSVSNGQSTNGMGVPKDRIKLFFNKTGTERFEDLQRTMRPYLTEGHLPTVQGLNDGGWIGNLTGGDFLNAVTSYASFMNRVSPMEELRPYQQRKPDRGTQRSGFMKMFGSRRG